MSTASRVLVIKLTSMGDLMHALPALTDASSRIPGITFDWVADEAFREVPSWHPAVEKIFTSAHRRWRGSVVTSLFNGEFLDFYKTLNAGKYDVIIDAQNNVKSSLISFLRKGTVHGMDRNSVAEKPAHLAYGIRHRIDKNQHAIARQRQLFAEALGYDIPDSPPEYGIRPGQFQINGLAPTEPYLCLVHNASWTTKLWPEKYWHELIDMAGREGYEVLLPGGSDGELARAAAIATEHTNATALPRLSLTELGGIVQGATGVVCCDTGLAHLTAITGTPSVTMYGPTSVKLIGTTGRNQEHLVAGNPPYSCAPCYKRVCSFNGGRDVMSDCMQSFSPSEVWQQLQAKISGRE